MNSGSPFRTLLKGSVIALFGNSLIYALVFVFQIMMVKMLGLEGYGIWGFAFTLILTVAQLSTMGLGFASVYFSSSGNSTVSVPSPAAAARFSVGAVLVVSGAAAALLPAASHFLIVPYYHFENIGSLITILAALVPLAAFISIAESIFRAHHDAAAAFKMKLVPEALKVVIVPSALLCFGADTRVVGAAMLVVLAAPAVYGAYMLNKLVVPLRSLLPVRNVPSAAAPMLAYALPFFLMEVFQIFRDRADTFIIGYLSTAGYLGIYKGAYVLAAMVSFIPTAVAYLLFPLMSKIVNDHDTGQLAVFGERTMKLLIYSGLPVMVGIILFARPLMTRVLGPVFLPGERALLFLTLSSASGIFHVFYGHVLAAKNRVRWLWMSNAAAVVLNLGLNILLIPGYGITGAALASLAGSILLTVVIARLAAVSLGRFVFPAGVAGALFTAFAFVAAAYVFRERSVAASCVLCVLFGACWSAWLINFERADLAAALEHVRSFVSQQRRN
ncbi:MAG: oligosaccharide flippase family protein [Elusimicrobiales bacterium]